MKITRFQDIPQFTQWGSWECDYDIASLIELIEELTDGKRAGSNLLNLNPDFQRAHVWTEQQQIAFIEFFLKGGKTGRVIYLNQPGWQHDYKGEFVIVDGKQRLEAIRRFVKNEIPVFGSFFKEFTDNKRSFRNTIRLNVNNLKTRKEVLNWYLQFNEGGTVHTPEELNKVRKLLEQEK